MKKQFFKLVVELFIWVGLFASTTLGFRLMNVHDDFIFAIGFIILACSFIAATLVLGRYKFIKDLFKRL